LLTHSRHSPTGRFCRSVEFIWNRHRLCNLQRPRRQGLAHRPNDPNLNRRAYCRVVWAV